MADPNSPRCNALCGLPPSFTLTKKVPRIDIRIPAAANDQWQQYGPRPLNFPTEFSRNSDEQKRRAPWCQQSILHMTQTRSAPMPATSPTLSPTLSAIVAGLSGMIFRNSRFHLTNQVSAHICGFCVDATTYTCEQCNRRSPKRKTGQYVEHLADIVKIHPKYDWNIV